MQGGQASRLQVISRVAIVALAMLVFFLMLGGSTILLRVLSFAFLAISGAVLIGGALVMALFHSSLNENHSKVFFLNGATTTLFAYFFITFGGVILSRLFVFNVALYVVLNLVFIGLVVATLCALFFAAGKIAESDKQVMEAKAFMVDCEAHVQKLMLDAANSEHAKPLTAIYEGIRYSDKVGHSDVDYKIYEAILRLEDALRSDDKSQTNFTKMFDEINSLLMHRKAQISQSKRGGF